MAKNKGMCATCGRGRPLAPQEPLEPGGIIVCEFGTKYERERGISRMMPATFGFCRKWKAKVEGE